MQAYGTSATARVDFEHLQDNVSFSHGVGGLLIGQASTNINDPEFTGNQVYDTAEQTSLDMGNYPWGQGCMGGVIQNNWVLGNTMIDPSCLPSTMTGNTIMWATNGFNKSSYPNNTYFGIGLNPATNQILVQQNEYDAQRYHIVVWNFQNLSSVQVPVGSILSFGDTYELHAATDYYGDVTKATFSGGDSLTVSMNGHAMVQPLGYGNDVGPLSWPEFGAFILVKTTCTSTGSPPLKISVSPAIVNLQTGGSLQFTSSVSGPNSGVAWSATGGTITGSGLYTAPASTGVFTVTASSLADSTESAWATVTVAALTPHPASRRIFLPRESVRCHSDRSLVSDFN
jgi:hypothetical protein